MSQRERQRKHQNHHGPAPTPRLWSRRDLLRTLAAVPLLASGPAGAWAAGADTPTGLPGGGPKIRVGFLGIAHSHFRQKHKILSESPDYEVVGLSETNPRLRDSGPAGARWLTPDELIDRCEVVVVESEVQDHFRDARRALRAGRHVHVEKPPAETEAQLRELLNLAAARNRFLQVGYMWRHNPGFNRALQAARAGWLGRVFFVRATMNTLASPANRKEWARFRGGAMFEHGCHLLDVVVRLMGEPTRVTPFLQRQGPDGLADNTLAVLEFPKAMAAITCAPIQENAFPQRTLEIQGTGGTAIVKPIEPPALTLDLAKPAGPYPAGRSEVALPPYQRYVDEFIALAQVIRGGAPPRESMETELAIQRTLVKACR